MKSNNIWAVLFAFACFGLVGCSSSPTQDSVDSVKPADAVKPATSEKGSLEKKFTLKPEDKVAKEINQSAATATVDASALLPAGPVTPNPYLMAKPKVSDAVDISFRDALIDMQQKNWAVAEAKLQKIAMADASLSGVQLNLGLIYRATNQPAKAEESFNRAINANPKNVYAMNQLAVLKREAGDFVAAEKLYQKALEVWPFYFDAHKNIAILYELYMGKPEMALPHYLACQQITPQPDKQIDSSVADLQRRLNIARPPAKKVDAPPATETEKAGAK